MMKRILAVCVAAVSVWGCGLNGNLCPAPRELPGTISTQLVIGQECSNWVATGNVTVAAEGQLIVEPGTSIAFPANAELRVLGALTADGTVDRPITFTGAEPTRGFWKGIQFLNSNSTQNLLRFVVVDYAGSSVPSFAEVASGIALITNSSNTTRAAIDQTTVRNSLGYGLELGANVTLPSFSENSFTANAEGAVHAHADAVHQLASDSSYAGNDQERVRIRPGSVTGTRAWQDLGVPYQVGDLAVEGDLTLQPGLVLEFESASALRVLASGSLNADGTSAAPITFAGVEATRGYWKGINLYNSNSTANVLRHVTVQHGGSAAFTYTDQAANVVLTTTSSAQCRLTIEDSLLEESGGHGLHLMGNARLSGFARNALSANDLGPAHLLASQAHALDGASTYAGNALNQDRVLVAGDGVAQAVTWPALDVPYRMNGRTNIEAGGHLTIEAGARLEFVATGDLYIQGALTAEGTVAEKVVFTRAPGVVFWKGLNFYNSSSLYNRLTHAEVTYGGAAQFTYAGAKGAVVLTHTSSNTNLVQLEDVHIANSDGYGIWASANSSVTSCAGVTFADNSLGNSTGPCL